MTSLNRPGHAPVDAWSLMHLASGLLLGVLTQTWWLALVLVVGFEILEAGMRRIKRHGKGLFEYESWPNIIADIVIGILGWYTTAFWIAIPDGWRLF
jgi:hypothetical protein